MIGVEQIRQVERSGFDFDSTQQLLARMRAIRTARVPLFLEKDEFLEVARWKLGAQYGRVAADLSDHSGLAIRMATGAALQLARSGNPTDEETAIRILTALSGVGVPVASAILAVLFPERFGVFDPRVWRQCFGDAPLRADVQGYGDYLRVIRRIAHELEWDVQQVDWCIWAHDKRTRNGNGH